MLALFADSGLQELLEEVDLFSEMFSLFSRKGLERLKEGGEFALLAEIGHPERLEICLG